MHKYQQEGAEFSSKTIHRVVNFFTESPIASGFDLVFQQFSKCFLSICYFRFLSQIPQSNDGKDWWEYIDPTVNKSLLDGMAFTCIFIYFCNCFLQCNRFNAPCVTQ